MLQDLYAFLAESNNFYGTPQDIQNIIKMLECLTEKTQETLSQAIMQHVVFDVIPYSKNKIMTLIYENIIKVASQMSEQMELTDDNLTQYQKRILKTWFCVHKVLRTQDSEETLFLKQKIKEMLLNQ